MIIEINYSEIEPNVKPIWDVIFNLSIDYYTNALHGTYNNKDYIICNFNNYGWVIDNRYNKYEIIKGIEKIFIIINDNKRTNRITTGS